MYKVWPNPLVETRLRELIMLFLARIYDQHTGHLDHFFDLDWQRLSDNYTFGHDIEASWLIWEAAEALADPGLCNMIRPFSVGLAEMVAREGMDHKTGGIYYAGRAGRVTETTRQWWPQAEAVTGFLNAYTLSVRSEFLDAAVKVWGFIERYIIDRSHGEWFWQVDDEGKPDHNQPKISTWKGPYHTVRCCIESLRRLGELTELAR